MHYGSLHSSWIRSKPGPPDLLDIPRPSAIHQDVKVCEKGFHDVPDARLAGNAHPVDCSCQRGFARATGTAHIDHDMVGDEVETKWAGYTLYSRPTQTACAPRARALNTSAPVRTPESNRTVALSPMAAMFSAFQTDAVPVFTFYYLSTVSAPQSCEGTTEPRAQCSPLEAPRGCLSPRPPAAPHGY
jgi:hypothetical protein